MFLLQGYGQKMMLRLIVETAIHWMRIGLPLKILKIVIFSRDNSKIDSNPLLHYFKELNLKWSKILENDDDQPEVSCFAYKGILTQSSLNDHSKCQSFLKTLQCARFRLGLFIEILNMQAMLCPWGVKGVRNLHVFCDRT